MIMKIAGVVMAMKRMIIVMTAQSAMVMGMIAAMLIKAMAATMQCI